MDKVGGQKRVRFARDAHKKLRSLPSHAGALGPVHAPIIAPRHLFWRRCWIGLAAFVVFAMAAFAIFVRAGYLTPLLESAASESVQNAVPPEFRVELGETDITFGFSHGIGIRFDDVKVYANSDDAPLATLGSVTLGVAAKPALAGRAEFSSISMENLTLQVPESGAGGLPKLRLDGAHNAFENLFVQLRSGLTPFLNQTDGLDISLANMQITLPTNGYSDEIVVDDFEFHAKGGAAEFNANLVVDGYKVPLSGGIDVPLADADPLAQSQLSLSLSGMPMPWRRLQTIVSNDPIDLEIGRRHIPLLANVSIKLTDNVSEEQDSAKATIVPLSMSFKLGADNYVPVNGSLDLDMDFQSGVMDIASTFWTIGRSSFDLHGGVRDRKFELGQKSEPNAFEFELLANRGTAAPADSPEAPLRFAARAQGTGFLDSKLIQFARLDVDSDSGTAYGEGEISLEGEFPTAVFDVRVDEFSIPGVKQFWPAPIARGARSWVLENLAGGRVIAGRFDIAEPLRRRISGTTNELSGDTRVKLEVEDVQFNVVGDIPPVRQADGTVEFAEGITTVSLSDGLVFLPSGRTAQATDGKLTIPPADLDTGLIRASLNMGIAGKAKAVGELITFNPIGAQQYYAFSPDDLAGDVTGRVNVEFSLNSESGADPDWDVDLQVSDAGSAAEIEGRQLDGLVGNIKVDPRRAEFDLQGNIDGFPSDIAMVVPFENSEVAAKRDIRLQLDTAAREKLAPGLETILTGNTSVKVAGAGETLKVEADLTPARLSLPWIGWAKGSGVKASAAFNLLQSDVVTTLSDFNLSGESFGAIGRIDADKDGLRRARFGLAQLNSSDDVSLDIERNGDGFDVDISGKSFDARAIMRHARAQVKSTGASDADVPVNVVGKIGRVQGFHGEHLDNVLIEMRVRSGTVTRLRLTGSTKSGFPVTLSIDGAGSGRSVTLEALGAGEFLRFADIYTNVRGGTVDLSLKGTGPQTLVGSGTIRDFRVFNEPKLAQLVSSKTSQSQSLEEAVNQKIDTREVKFEIASSDLTFQPGQLDIARAVARGPLAGFSIQGLVFDANNQTRLTGTFLPAYGLNRLFGEIPILGALLGNGRDRGLIGVTFKLDGSYDDPNVTVNPLSVIAPGIFRSIFEFR